MPNRRLTRVDISGVTVFEATQTSVSGSLLKWQIKENFGNPVYTANLEFNRNVNSTVPLKEGQTVDIWMGYTNSTDEKRFSGELISFEPEAGKIIVKAFNKLNSLVRNTINAKIYDRNVVGDPAYSSGKISEVFKDLVNTYGGLTADDTSVVDSGTTLTINQFVCDQTDPKERIDKLAEALGWVYYYNAVDDLVYFRPKDFSANSNVLTVGDNVVNVPEWKYDKADLINDLRLDGVFQNKILEDKFTGNGSTATFTLSSTPVGDIAVYVNALKNYASGAPVQNELQVLGVTNSTSGSFAYTVDKGKRSITFESSFIPAAPDPTAGANNVLASYSASLAVPVHITDDVSVGVYGTHARTMQLTDVLTVQDAELRVQEVLNKFKDPDQSADLEVRQISGASFSVGESVRVVDNYNRPVVDDRLTVYGITLNYPKAFDVLRVGDREFDPPEYFINMSERIHRLERELISEGTILTEIKQITFPLSVSPDQLVVREEYINDTFILDHAINSVLWDGTQTSLVDDFEVSANWVEGSGSVSLTIADNAVVGEYWVGTQGVKATWVATSGTGVMENTDSQGDLRHVVGVTSGTPTKGTGGVWVYAPEGADISELRLRIGSSSVAYREYIGQTYKQISGYEGSFSIENTTRTLVLFDLDNPDASAGTPDWTAIDFVQLRFVIASAGNMTFDYLTVSASNSISATGLMENTGRETLKVETTHSY